MLNGKRVAVILPAYNAARTLEATYAEIPKDLVDNVILVDDFSSDHTAALSRALGIETVVHPVNRGYGGNQKTCYRIALERGADIVVMLHPDYQYTPKLIRAMVSMIAEADFDVVLASRILGVGALAGGMPRYKYLANRFLTLVQNVLCGHKLSEYHSGYRAWSRQVLESLPLLSDSDDFVFDNCRIPRRAGDHLSHRDCSCFDDGNGRRNDLRVWQGRSTLLARPFIRRDGRFSGVPHPPP